MTLLALLAYKISGLISHFSCRQLNTVCKGNVKDNSTKPCALVEVETEVSPDMSLEH